MTKEFWVNLPVKDISRSRVFFTELGFTFNPHYGNNDHSISLLIGEKNVVIMLFAEPLFEGFSQNKSTDTSLSNEALFSIDAESRGEVDEWARKAEAAGGTVFGKPAENQGWMYGCGFADLDGHRWNVLHMDMDKMPQ